ncbi:MAG: transposase [Betaproteobacteria bacterium]|nr:transposase [Betaproteobacteria bacterium]
MPPLDATRRKLVKSVSGRRSGHDECLNDHDFHTLAHARAVIAAWRHDYNEATPHSSIGRIPPAEFAACHRLHVGNDATPKIV